MSKTTKKLNTGGLFRCCIQSLAEFANSDEYKEDEGTVLTCYYCHEPTMIVKNDIWQWNRWIECTKCGAYAEPYHNAPNLCNKCGSEEHNV